MWHFSNDSYLDKKEMQWLHTTPIKRELKIAVTLPTSTGIRERGGWARCRRRFSCGEGGAESISVGLLTSSSDS